MSEARGYVLGHSNELERVCVLRKGLWGDKIYVDKLSRACLKLKAGFNQGLSGFENELLDFEIGFLSIWLSMFYYRFYDMFSVYFRIVFSFLVFFLLLLKFV